MFAAFLVETVWHLGERRLVRYVKKPLAVICVSLLAAAHVMGTIPVSSQTNPQAAEKQEQETVDLKISGMK